MPSEIKQVVQPSSSSLGKLKRHEPVVRRYVQVVEHASEFFETRSFHPPRLHLRFYSYCGYSFMQWGIGK